MDRPPLLPATVGGRWRTWALLGSLVVNLFLAGVLLGRSLVPGQAAPPVVSAGAGATAGLGVKMRALPPVDRLKFAAVFARHRPEIHAARTDLRLKNEISRAALAATPYDKAKAEAAFADVRTASARLQTAMQATLTDGVADISLKGRTALAAPPVRPASASPPTL